MKIIIAGILALALSSAAFSMVGIPIWQVQTAELHVPIIIDGVKA
jgi:hypothetical protein